MSIFRSHTDKKILEWEDDEVSLGRRLDYEDGILDWTRLSLEEPNMKRRCP
jgi:hypothetical protein